MSIKKFRLNRKNFSGSYDTIHYETSSNIVLRPDGTTVEETLNSILPTGLITMWSGSADAIPSGWDLCDGSNGTPDLRNRFIVGAGSTYQPGNTGGSDAVTLTVENMPPHNHGHNLSVASNGSHTHNFSGTTSISYSITSTGSGKAVYSSNPGTKYDIVNVLNSSGGVNHSHTYSGTTTAAGDHVHAISGAITNSGLGQAHENRPPYYALCFIMKK